MEVTVFNNNNNAIWSENYTLSNNAKYWDGKHTAGNSVGKIIEGTYKYTLTALTESGKNLNTEGEVSVITALNYCINNISKCYFSDQTFGSGTDEVLYCK
jgi:hypothetical protein